MLGRALWSQIRPYSVETVTERADLVDVRYGPHERHVLDVWLAKRSSPSPLMMFIHGGGFRKGDKYWQWPAGMLACLRQAGITVASIQYRFSSDEPYPAPMLDGARALQFLRYNAEKWNIDKSRVALSGVSAGGGISLWLALRPDMAQPDATDPILRESTRVNCAICLNTQSTYDVRTLRSRMGGPAYQCSAIHELCGLKPEDLDHPPPDVARRMEESSALTHVSASAPPVYMLYTHENAPLDASTSMNVAVHHPQFGEMLKERMDASGRECVATWKGDATEKPNYLEFLFRHLGVE